MMASGIVSQKRHAHVRVPIIRTHATAVDLVLAVAAIQITPHAPAVAVAVKHVAVGRAFQILAGQIVLLTVEHVNVSPVHPPADRMEPEAFRTNVQGLVNKNLISKCRGTPAIAGKRLEQKL